MVDRLCGVNSILDLQIVCKQLQKPPSKTLIKHRFKLILYFLVIYFPIFIYIVLFTDFQLTFHTCVYITYTILSKLF